MPRNFKDPAPSPPRPGQPLQPPGGKGGLPTMRGLWEGWSQEGDTHLQPCPQEGTQPEHRGLSGLPVSVRLALRKGWLSHSWDRTQEELTSEMEPGALQARAQGTLTS